MTLERKFAEFTGRLAFATACVCAGIGVVEPRFVYLAIVVLFGGRWQMPEESDE